jgi:transcription initiation factor TFIID TATA-box-binding protein
VSERTNLEIEIHNVVATANLNQRFNLVDIFKHFKNAEYRPKQFPGLVFRLKRPKTTTLIFRTGKMVCTGAKSVKTARSAIRKVIRELKKNGIIVLSKPVITIQNIVASANLQHKIDLEEAADLLDNVMYEPEQFPGLIYRLKEPKTVMLVFASGKIVCTGGTSAKMIDKAINTLYETCDDYDLFYQQFT